MLGKLDDETETVCLFSTDHPLMLSQSGGCVSVWRLKAGLLPLPLSVLFFIFTKWPPSSFVFHLFSGERQSYF